MSKELADRQFEYLLNAMENAGAQDNPHEHGYGEKRKAVLDYVAALRSEPVAWSAHGIKREDTCVWVQDSDGPWNTSCGKVFEFTNEGPAENEANFCYHCGGALLPEPYSDAAPSREQDQRSGVQKGAPSSKPDSQESSAHGFAHLDHHANEPIAKVVVIDGQYVSLTAAPWQLQKLKRMDGQLLYVAPVQQGQRSETVPLSTEASQEAFAGAPGQQSSDHPTPARLSAEQIEVWRRFFNVKFDYTESLNAICDMALSSLTARDEGIEAAAKLIRKRLDGIYEDHSYTEQDTGAVVIDNAEIEGRANELEELEEEIRALAQGQWSKSTVSTSHVTGETQQDAEPADHPTEQDADELLRVEHDFRIAPEELTRIRNNGCGNDWPKVWNVQLNELCDAYRELRRIDAHLARKEQA